jgi:hypothetical protein
VLMRLTRGLGRRAASALVILYALCLPPAALALSDASHAARCISHDHHGLAPVHAHQDGAAHTHSGDDGDGKGEPGQCCGLICLTALPVSPPMAETEPPAPTPISMRHEGFAGHTPDRLYRPPISLLSL